MQSLELLSPQGGSPIRTASPRSPFDVDGLSKSRLTLEATEPLEARRLEAEEMLRTGDEAALCATLDDEDFEELREQGDGGLALGDRNVSMRWHLIEDEVLLVLVRDEFREVLFETMVVVVLGGEDIEPGL